MKKQVVGYRFLRYCGIPLQAKREISYDIKLSSRLILDELCYSWNKNNLEQMINQALDESNREAFLQLSQLYKFYYLE